MIGKGSILFFDSCQELGAARSRASQLIPVKRNRLKKLKEKLQQQRGHLDELEKHISELEQENSRS
jgi:hypothetical protein